MTRQRRVILEELEKSREHPTAGELYDLVRQRLPRISLGTVYRTLDLLAASGLAQKLELSGAPARFDGRVEGHYHIRCLSCGRLDDIHPGPLPDVRGTLQAHSTFRVTGLRLECTGICPDCSGETDAPPRTEDRKSTQP
jgi:Fur family ferric uptake transcriptional regulator